MATEEEKSLIGFSQKWFSSQGFGNERGNAADGW